MKLFYFILPLLFISCGKNQENKELIEELESNIEYLESKIQYYESLDCDSINQYDNAVIKDIIFKNDKEAYVRFIPSSEFFYNQERYLFLVLNMFLVNKEKSYSYDVYQTLSGIYYFDLTHELKNSKLYYFTLYFYAFSVFEDSSQREENALKSGLNPNNVKNPNYYLSNAYE